MATLQLTKTRIQAGVYEGVLTSEPRTSTAPKLHASLGGRALERQVTIEPDAAQDGAWTVRLHVPTEALTDGVQSFVIAAEETGETLDSFTILTGEPLEGDLRAEIDLLRAELDMLKKAFRRHCVETG